MCKHINAESICVDDQFETVCLECGETLCVEQRADLIQDLEPAYYQPQETYETAPWWYEIDRHATLFGEQTVFPEMSSLVPF